MKTLFWETSRTAQEPYYLVNYESYRFRKIRNFHCHRDFAELFWITDGRCQHSIGNKKDTLTHGKIVFIRPQDAHGLEIKRGGGFSITNIAFHVETLDFLRNRYPKTANAFFPEFTSPNFSTELTTEQLQNLHSMAHELSISQQSKLTIERFLLNVFYELSPKNDLEVDVIMPDWLKKATVEIQKPSNFRDGLNAFVSIACKSPEHTAREVKKATGKTITQIVNEARIKYAAHQLLSSNKKILVIADDSGYESVSYFYKKFAEHFQLTPLQYRKNNRKLI